MGAYLPLGCFPFTWSNAHMACRAAGIGTRKVSWGLETEDVQWVEL